MAALELAITDAAREAIRAAGFREDRAPSSIRLEVDAALRDALAAAGFHPTIRLGRRQMVVEGEDGAYTLTEMADETLQRWLALQVVAGQELGEAKRGGDPLRLLATAQTVHVQLVAMALGIPDDVAAALTPADRRLIVRTQDQLNETAVYAGLMER